MDNIIIGFSIKTPKYIECVNHISNHWVIRFDNNLTSDNTYQYCEYKFNHKPTINEVKDVITKYYNKKTSKKQHK